MPAWASEATADEPAASVPAEEVGPPEPMSEPDEAEAPFDAAEPQPLRDAEPAAAPHIEPWSPDADPWGAAWTVPPADGTGPSADGEGVADEAMEEAEPIAGGGEGEPVDVQPGAAAAALSAAGTLPAEPDVEVEAGTEADAEPEPPAQADEPADQEATPDVAAADGTWDADIETAPMPEPAIAPPIWAPEPTAVEEAADDGEPSLEPAEAEQDVPDEPVAAEGEGADAGAAEPDEPGAGEPKPHAEGSPWDADLWDRPAPEVATAAAAAAVDGGEDAAGEEDEPSITPGIAAAAAALGLTDPGFHAPEASAPSPGPAEVEPAAVSAEAPAGVEADAPDAAPEPAWQERPDATEVFPTTWAPPPPPPPAPSGLEAGMDPRAGDIRTTLGQAEPELDDALEEEPTTAEQAVPWLIGVILLLAGMVIVLLALIFAGDASLGGAGDLSPTPAVAVIPSTSAAPSASSPVSPSPSPRGSAEPSASATPLPEYGALEMVYQGRSAALAPIYLLRRDFTVEGEPEVMARDPTLDVRRFAWSPDGTLGAFLYADLLVGIDPGVDTHQLTEAISAITFGDDGETVYAVRVRADGGNDVATVLAVNQANGKERELDRISYPRPAIEEEAPLAEAQFSDDGGSIRLYWMHDDTLRLWILGAGAWTIDPADGNATKLDGEELPVLWAHEGERRIRLAFEDNETRIRIVDRSGDTLASTRVEGRVSHLRWSPRGDQVVFTLGRSTAGGGVIQNLYLWSLGAGNNPDPQMITNTGAAFGAEWLGSQNRWEDD